MLRALVGNSVLIGRKEALCFLAVPSMEVWLMEEGITKGCQEEVALCTQAFGIG